MSMVASSSAITGPSERLIELAKDTLQPSGYTCEWQDRTTKCGVILGSWNAYKKHLRVVHCKAIRSQSWKECKLQKCNLRVHRSHQELESHIANSHLSRIPIICPVKNCNSQRALKFSDLPQHFRDYHPDACIRTPPSHMHFSTLLRPSKLQTKGPPNGFSERYLCGLTIIQPGLAKRGPRLHPSSSPMASQKRQIPRYPRQVPSSKLNAKSPTKSVGDSEDDDDFDLELEDLESLHDSPESVGRSIVVARRGAGMDMDLSRPGPMLDPRIFGPREPPLRIYYPYFKAYIEEEERKMHQKEAQEKGDAEVSKHSGALLGSKEVKTNSTALSVPPLPSRKSL